jgi:hypothetical protein
MKKLIIMSALVISGLSYKTADAQIGINIGFHLHTHQVYAPEPVVVEQPVYQEQAPDDYYYLPDVEAYYSIPQHCYYYQDGDRWISAAYLPGRYHDYDWRSERRYEVRAIHPYMHHDFYRAHYGGFLGSNNGWGHNGNYYARRDNFNYAAGDHDDHHFNNKGWGGNRGDNHYDNRNAGYDRSHNDRNHDRGNWGGGQPSNQDHNSYNGGQSHNNGAQPSNQNHHDNNGGQSHNGGGQHFAQNNNGGYNRPHFQ